MAKKDYKIKIPRTKPKKYDLYEEIRKDRLYRDDVKVRDFRSRKYVEANGKMLRGREYVVGNLYMFNYFEPKTKDELEYYDAMPCSILFGLFTTEKGEKRILGFNLHYYPPRIRYRVLARIMEIWDGIYKLSWNSGLSKDMDKFTYYTLIANLQKAKLEFGVRMYIPSLMSNIRIVPPGLWEKAVFSEGRFKKKTRDAILNYWKRMQDNLKLINKAKKNTAI